MYHISYVNCALINYSIYNDTNNVITDRSIIMSFALTHFEAVQHSIILPVHKCACIINIINISNLNRVYA